jgi:hypothetical protein
MKQTIFLYLLCSVFVQQTFSQVKWSADSKTPDQIAWDNYSTSYMEDVGDSLPFLVTCIPYNGTYSNAGDINTPLDLSFEGSLFRFRSALSDRSRKLYTYDSSEVFFLSPGIYKNNASVYEYRVTLNGNMIMVPWSNITRFADLNLGTFKKGFGFLGGYKTIWGNFITVELRKKGSDTSFSSAIVYWKETKPLIASIYTLKNFNELFALLKEPWDKSATSSIPLKNPVFASTENSIIFYLEQDIYKKEAIEYELIRDGKVFIDWKTNDYDNNFIWLKELEPGKYKLNLRFSKQRHNVSGYDFEIKPRWDQTLTFRILAGGLIAAFFGFLLLLYRLRHQRQKLRRTKLQKDKAEMELRSIYTQLNPHFIFNALSSIQGLINKNEMEKANHYLSTFSKLLRDSLVNSEKDRVPLSTELQALETYLQLEQLRFHFAYTIEVEESIPARSVEVPSLLLQPLIENAIKHGVSSMFEKGRIHIRFSREGADLKASITDNGKGFDMAAVSNGFGLKLTKERIRLLNEADKDDPVNLSIQSEKNNGTTIVVSFKNLL